MKVAAWRRSGRRLTRCRARAIVGSEPASSAPPAAFSTMFHRIAGAPPSSYVPKAGS
jgi:hypothetical protein